MSGFNDFAPFFPINGCFIVQNIGTPPKTLFVFDYPIPYMKERDILKIPGVSEADIRASLLKGILNHYLTRNQLQVICSDIDLLQFNAAQKAFLQSGGIVNGLSVNTSESEFTYYQDVVLNGAVDGVNTIFTIPGGQKFVQNGIQNILVYENGVRQLYLSDYVIAESQGIGTGYDTVVLFVAPSPTPAPPDVITADYYVAN